MYHVITGTSALGALGTQQEAPQFQWQPVADSFSACTQKVIIPAKEVPPQNMPWGGEIVQGKALHVCG